ncbi:cytohesin-1-like isoform X1 [Sitodiplosis mosellana]|uniref:cytohesin-1-like isoform X1 n=1 Tax=Sitodiplosis mosellana TaxID=263140 RepID=UPI0024437C4D|nr:cytohesin-1-like isoform X1 [Sitodiplosis mosellana]
MSTLQTERKPSVSTWFSSLRRQPKPKKVLASKKQLQKSCVDLSSIPNDVKSLPASVTNSPKLKNGFFRENYFCLSPLKSLANGTKSNSLDSSDTPKSPPSNKSSKMRTYSTTSSRSNGSSSSSGTDSNRGQTITKITKVTKTTVITTTAASAITLSHASNNRLNRIGTIFDDEGQLISNLDVYKNYTNSFRSNIIKNDSASSCSSGSQKHINNNSVSQSNNNGAQVRFVDDNDDNDKYELTSDNNDTKTKGNTAISYISVSGGSGGGGGDDDSGTSCKKSASINSITNRPFKSNSLNLDDDIEFIDTSSSLSDIGGSGGIESNFGSLENTSMYYNTLPKLPKSCATCKTQQQQQKQQAKSKSDWNISVHKKQIKDELCEVVAEMETLDLQEDCKHSNKDKQMSIGRKKFNMDPKKGIEYLCENNLLQMDAQDVAHFLYKGEGLNKTAIGDYLGEKNDFNEQVLKAFVELHDFTNLILVQALRQFLWSFRLPGEAQKIDRMMECFAQRYCQLNPDIFTNTDTCYVLSFAIIMLNTSLHNPSVKDKPSVEQFISMNRGINNGGDLPRELLVSLYESIRTEPFKIPQDDGNDLMHTFFNPDKEGWLWKQGGRYKSWKRRWFILNDNCLYYFEYTTDKEPRGIIPLENILVREIHDRSKPHCFELYACGGADIIKACKTDSEGKVVEGKHSVYRMSAATEEDKQEWIKCLTSSISHNPFYDILVQRKKKALTVS